MYFKSKGFYRSNGNSVWIISLEFTKKCPWRPLRSLKVSKNLIHWLQSLLYEIQVWNSKNRLITLRSITGSDFWNYGSYFQCSYISCWKWQSWNSEHELITLIYIPWYFIKIPPKGLLGTGWKGAKGPLAGPLGILGPEGLPSYLQEWEGVPIGYPNLLASKKFSILFCRSRFQPIMMMGKE